MKFMKHIKRDKIFLLFIFFISITLAVGIVLKHYNKPTSIKEGMSIEDAFDPNKNGMTSAFNKVGDGIKDKMEGPFKQIADFFDWLRDIFNAIGDSVACVFKKIGLLPKCSKWYFFDFVGKLCYSPFAFIFWFIDLQTVEDSIWEFVYTFDDMCYETTGIHFAHFPDDAVNDCYKFCDVYYPPWPF